mgnify:CR=1 FL=1|jgi:hydrogenase expression/formation protein HypD
MKHLEEYRDKARCDALLQAIEAASTRPWTLMEICGGQTHSLIRNGIPALLPDPIRLVHGPGCPVCVTPPTLIDQAIALAFQPGVLLCTFGDMMRVPGTTISLQTARSQGAAVQMVYSPLEAVRLAQQTPERKIVFFAVGFETTAPANALAVMQAHLQHIDNFSILSSHVLVPPAMTALLEDPTCVVDGFLAAGHVCTIMGQQVYRQLAADYKIPIVITGFEPVDLLQGILLCVEQLEKGTWKVENQYERMVHQDGNAAARELMEQVYTTVDRDWRGLGRIPQSGLALKAPFDRYDAALLFDVQEQPYVDHSGCRAGSVLKGSLSPTACPLFGKSCTPEHPIGAPMVSSEGACAAYYYFNNN